MRRLLVGLAIGLASAVLAGLAGQAPLARTIELKTYDLRARATATPDATRDDIVLVSITDDSLRRLEPLVGRWPWPRLVHGMIVDFLARAPARLVVYDVLFTEADRRSLDLAGVEWSGAESDAAFADAVRRAGNVIVAADVADEGLADSSKALAAPLDGITGLEPGLTADDCVERRPVLVPPYPGLGQAARAVGHTMLIKDADGPVRRVVPFVRYGDRVVPSLAMAAALDVLGLGRTDVAWEPGVLRLGTSRVPLVEQAIPDYYGAASRACRALLPYRGPPVNAAGHRTFPEFSAYSLIYSEQALLEGATPEIDPAVFRDKVVIVGTTASGTYEVFTTPVAEAMAGPEIHANAIDALTAGRTLAPAGPGGAAALVAAAGFMTGLTGAFAGAWLTAAVALGAAVALVWGSTLAFGAGSWLPLVSPLLAIAFAFVGDLGWRYVVEGREKRAVKQLFSRYVSRDVFTQLVADPARAALGGRRRVMSVLFCDLRGFTPLTERLDAEDLVRQLNEYFTRMVEEIFLCQGTVDKFVGDMVMALFGAPLDDPAHADHAVQAAIRMSAALDALNEAWAARDLPALDIGIGVNTGEMVAGNIGSNAIMSYTVIGDAVNLGARLESETRAQGVRIIISEATRAALSGRYDIRPLGEVTVKGKSRPVSIYEVKG
ncbi:MAG: CHASE2 domain-containing protein [Vicinamibacterales bacterium]